MPPPNLTISQWADKYRRLSSEASAEPGQWKTSRAQYQKGMMDAISDPTVENVVVMSSSQVGKTELENNALGYYIHQDPAPIMLVMPTERDAETWSKDRFAPMARDTPCLRAKIGDPKSRDGSNKILHKKFPGGHLTIVGANAPSGLASRPIRILLCDEVDRYPASAGAEGDPVNLAKKRTTTFWNRKVVLVSTPTIKGASRIEMAYEQSDQRRYWVPCPACHTMQKLIWPQVKWDKNQPETAHYECEHCQAHWSDSKRWLAVKQGQWRAEKPFINTAGFHLNEIYSSWVRLEEMARNFLSAYAMGDQALKTFKNTALGETWEEVGEAPDWQRLYDRREDYRGVPNGGLFLSAGTDIQKDRIEVSVWAWGRGKESWLIEHRVLAGETAYDQVWKDLSSMLNETWTHESGAQMPIKRMAVDSGYVTQEVYAWVRQHRQLHVMAVKGVAGGNVLVGLPKAVDVNAKGKRLSRGTKLYTVSGGIAKLELFNNLRQDPPLDEHLELGETYPPGYVHFPKVDGEYCQQLCAEQLVTNADRYGYTKRSWQKIRERNEALDCYVYARAAASVIGLDRFEERHFRVLEKNLGVHTREVFPIEGDHIALVQALSSNNKPIEEMANKVPERKPARTEVPNKPKQPKHRGGWLSGGLGGGRGGGWL